MRIGLIDVDGHNFPNLALMRISAFHKAQGDTVEWWDGWEYYQRVYKSKVFSDEYSPDDYDPVNCDELVKGGTGYAIRLVNGKEVFGNDPVLPPEIEGMKPDYSIYPQYDFAIAMTSRGCPRGCPFCHIAAKEGRASRKVADLERFYDGQPHIEVLDPNITACRDKRELFAQYRETNATINFNQGLDIRLLNGDDLEDINQMRVVKIHFAWDNPEDDLADRFKWYSQNAKHKPHGRFGMVYILTNYNSTMEDNLRRIYTVRDLGFDPYVMVYDKMNAPQEIRKLQRWCNNQFIFRSTKRFEEYEC